MWRVRYPGERHQSSDAPLGRHVRAWNSYSRMEQNSRRVLLVARTGSLRMRSLVLLKGLQDWVVRQLRVLGIWFGLVSPARGITEESRH